MAIPGLLFFFNVLICALCGVGLYFRYLLKRKELSAEALVDCFWLGFAFLILVLQIWHFFMPVNSLCFLLLLILGSAGIVFNLKAVSPVAGNILKNHKLLLLSLLFIEVWLLNRSLGPRYVYYDEGLYYLQSVKWNETWPIITGLGNLHSRLAYNNSHFLYVAMLKSFGFLGDHFHVYVNTMFFFVIFVELFVQANKLQKGSIELRSIFSLLMLAPIMAEWFGADLAHPELPVLLRTGSIDADSVIFVLGVVVFGRLLALIETKHDAEISWHSLVLLITLALGITVKGSFLTTAGPALLFLTGWFLFHKRWAWFRGAWLYTSAIIGFLLLGIWALRNVVLSGYLLYPGGFVAFPVEWRIPRALALSEWNWIRSWALKPGMHWTDVLYFRDEWLQNWFNSFSLYQVPVFALSLFVSVALKLLNRQYLILLTVLFPICFWFWSAPDPRFAGSLLWVLMMLSIALVLVRVSDTFQLGRMGTIVSVLLLFVVMNSHFFRVFKSPFWIAMPEEKSSLGDLPESSFTKAVTQSGLVVYSPSKGDQCWDAPLPCTPYYRPTLRLREKGNIAKGFVLEKDHEFGDMRVGGLPEGLWAASQIGVVRTSGWYSWEQPTGAIWMKNEARLLLYSATQIQASVTLLPAIIQANLSSGLLLITNLDTDERLELKLIRGKKASFTLNLKEGFNLLQLELAEGNFVPAEFGSEDNRELSVAFAEIRVGDNLINTEAENIKNRDY